MKFQWIFSKILYEIKHIEGIVIMDIKIRIYWSEDLTLHEMRHEKLRQFFSQEKLRSILKNVKPPTEHPYNKTKILVVGIREKEVKGFMCNIAISGKKQSDGTPVYIRVYDNWILNFDKYAVPLPIDFDEEEIKGLPYYS